MVQGNPLPGSLLSPAFRHSGTNPHQSELILTNPNAHHGLEAHGTNKKKPSSGGPEEGSKGRDQSSLSALAFRYS